MKKKTNGKMKRTVEIMGSYGGTYNRGNYENDKDLYSIKEVIENADDTITEEYITSRQRLFRDMCRTIHEEDGKALKQPQVSVEEGIVYPTQVEAEENRRNDLNAMITQCKDGVELAALVPTIDKAFKSFKNENNKTNVRTEYKFRLDTFKENRKCRT